MEKQLFRSKKNRVVAGVCGGVAEYLRVDPTLVRLVWVAVSLAYGTGVIAYIIAAIIMPDDKRDTTSGTDNWNESAQDWTQHGGTESPDFKQAEWKQEPPKFDEGKSRNIAGILLIVIGILFLGKTIFNWLDFKMILPVVLIAGGGYLLYRSRGRNV